MNVIMKFLQSRPSDTTIRLIRIFFWLMYIWVLYYNFFLNTPLNEIQDNLFWISISDNVRVAMKYIITAFWLLPLIMWATNLCIAKAKYVRIWEIVFGILLFYFSHIIVEWPDLDVDALLIFMWLIPLFWWITGKMITSKCMNYWYKQTKIRV